jgi:hypothetical protein
MGRSVCSRRRVRDAVAARAGGLHSGRNARTRPITGRSTRHVIVVGNVKISMLLSRLPPSGGRGPSALTEGLSHSWWRRGARVIIITPDAGSWRSWRVVRVASGDAAVRGAMLGGVGWISIGLVARA